MSAKIVEKSFIYNKEKKFLFFVYIFAKHALTIIAKRKYNLSLHGVVCTVGNLGPYDKKLLSGLAIATQTTLIAFGCRSDLGAQTVLYPPLIKSVVLVLPAMRQVV